MDQTQIIVKLNGEVQLEDKRIQANLNWNIKKLKGVLSEIYKNSDEQKIIYSGKLLSDNAVLKDVLRQYDGQEAHTIHLVFTPKQISRRIYDNSKSSLSNMSDNSEGLRQRINASARETVSNSNTQQQPQQQQQNTDNQNSQQPQQQQQPNTVPVPVINNVLNVNQMAASSSGNPHEYVLAQQFAMQTWLQQAYSQYLNQYMNVLSMGSQPGFMASQNQHQQQAHLHPMNIPAFMQNSFPNLPFAVPDFQANNFSAANPVTPISVPSAVQSTDVQSDATAQQPNPPPAQQQEAAQRRFPNIIQDEQENRDWLDILYSMSRLMILLCLVYFYSSPFRCLIVIIIGVAIYCYHIYKQNLSQMNNNSPRVNNNNLTPPAPGPEQRAGENEEGNDEDVARNNNEENVAGNANGETSNSDNTQNENSVVAFLRTFVMPFFASIIPEAPAL
jgi:hypothetical protein